MQKTIDRQQLAELYASICVDLSEDREKYGEENAWHELMGTAKRLHGFMIQRRHGDKDDRRANGKYKTWVVVYDSADDWKNNREPLVIRPEFQ